MRQRVQRQGRCARRTGHWREDRVRMRWGHMSERVAVRVRVRIGVYVLVRMWMPVADDVWMSVFTCTPATAGNTSTTPTSMRMMDQRMRMAVDVLMWKVRMWRRRQAADYMRR